MESAIGTRVHALAFAVMAAAPLFGQSSVWAQTETAAADSPYEVPRTPWGDPNLEGVWDYRTSTPLERRPELGERAFYTEEEVAELEGSAAPPHRLGRARSWLPSRPPSTSPS